MSIALARTSEGRWVPLCIYKPKQTDVPSTGPAAISPIFDGTSWVTLKNYDAIYSSEQGEWYEVGFATQTSISGHCFGLGDYTFSILPPAEHASFTEYEVSRFFTVSYTDSVGGSSYAKPTNIKTWEVADDMSSINFSFSVIKTRDDAPADPEDTLVYMVVEPFICNFPYRLKVSPSESSIQGGFYYGIQKSLLTQTPGNLQLNEDIYQ